MDELDSLKRIYELEDELALCREALVGTVAALNKAAHATLVISELDQALRATLRDSLFMKRAARVAALAAIEQAQISYSQMKDVDKYIAGIVGVTSDVNSGT